MSAATRQLASTKVVGRRFGAAVIDLALVGAAISTLFFIGAERAGTGGNAFACADLQQSNAVSNCVAIGDTLYYLEGAAAVRFGIVCLAVWLTFLAIIPALLGGSLGKMMVGLRVVDRFGSQAGIGRHLGRWVLFAVDGFPYCFPIVGVAMVAASKTNQRVGDRAAGTFVVAAGEVGRPVIDTPTTRPVVWSPPAANVPPGATSWSPPGLTGPQSAPSTAAPTPASAAPGSGTPQSVGPSAAGLPPGAEMRWDERWNAWLYWDPASRRWLRHDQATNQWIPI